MDADVTSNASGGGILSGYMGHSSFKDAEGNLYPVVVENCYFTGTLKSKGYVGVLGGTLNSSPIIIRNVYTRVDVTGTGMSGNYCGGLVGRVRSSLTLQNCYSAGCIDGPMAASIAAGGQNSSTPPSLYQNVIAWNPIVNGESVSVPFAVTAEGDELQNTYIFSEMLVNGEPVQGGLTHTQLQEVAGQWGSPWYADPSAGNGYPILQWQYDRGDYRSLCGFPVLDGIEDVGDGAGRSSGSRGKNVPGQAEVYDLTGRRVHNPTYGIYIVNGKRIMIK